eukprot:m.373350 g.373350  ORF g.373350 m.373350 type:complete len:148 (+) comp56149_c1_seq1:36-479(+)
MGNTESAPEPPPTPPAPTPATPAAVPTAPTRAPGTPPTTRAPGTPPTNAGSQPTNARSQPTTEPASVESERFSSGDVVRLNWVIGMDNQLAECQEIVRRCSPAIITAQNSHVCRALRFARSICDSFPPEFNRAGRRCMWLPAVVRRF